MVGKTNVAGARLRSVISVTYPEGGVCTCSNGTKTLKARGTSGKALFNVSTGTWTVTATDGNKTKSTTVSITEEGQTAEVNLNFVFLYSVGNMHTELGGNWTTTGYSREGWGGFANYSPTNTNKGLSVNTEGEQTSVFGKAKKVDFTNYSRLFIKVAWVESDFSHFFIASTKTLVGESNSVAYKDFEGETGEISIDVSGIIGSYYVMFAFFNGTCLIEEVGLE